MSRAEQRAAKYAPVPEGSDAAGAEDLAATARHQRRIRTLVLSAVLAALAAIAAAAWAVLHEGRGAVEMAPPVGLHAKLKKKPGLHEKAKGAGDWHCLVEDDVDYKGEFFLAIKDIFSAPMCCGECEAYDTCGAWSWGKKEDTPGLTNVCFLKKLPADGGMLKKVPTEGVVSGLPAKKTRKFGLAWPPPSKTAKTQGVVAKPVDPHKATPTCPGNINITGHGQVTLANAHDSLIEAIDGDLVVPHMGGRTYLADWCAEGVWNNTQYATMKLLGRTLRYTTDVSGTGCGCNAALYLVSMKQNPRPGNCWEYYCDAMSVCGVPCAEIDIQEANQYAWLSTMHAHSNTSGPDKLGRYMGYGHSLPGDEPAREWTDAEYGWGARCVDTSKPFDVAVSFPVDEDGTLTSLDIELSQPGKPCSVSGVIDKYKYWTADHLHHNGLQELTESLKDGMTVVMSYWNSSSLQWMDGLGPDGKGPCVQSKRVICPPTVRFYNFSVADIGPAAGARAHSG